MNQSYTQVMTEDEKVVMNMSNSLSRTQESVNNNVEEMLQTLTNIVQSSELTQDELKDMIDSKTILIRVIQNIKRMIRENLPIVNTILRFFTHKSPKKQIQDMLLKLSIVDISEECLKDLSLVIQKLEKVEDSLKRKGSSLQAMNLKWWQWALLAAAVIGVGIATGGIAVAAGAGVAAIAISAASVTTLGSLALGIKAIHLNVKRKHISTQIDRGIEEINILKKEVNDVERKSDELNRTAREVDLQTPYSDSPIFVQLTKELKIKLLELDKTIVGIDNSRFKSTNEVMRTLLNDEIELDDRKMD